MVNQKLLYSTPADGAYFFGFHDLCPWHLNKNLLAVHRVENACEKRLSTADDTAKILIWDVLKNSFKEIGTTTAWNWQQGARLQWLPGQSDMLLFNIRGGNNFHAKTVNIETREEQVLPYACYAVSSDGHQFISPDFSRLGKFWPAYGYSGVGGTETAALVPDNDGIWTFSLGDQEPHLLVSIADVFKHFDLPVPKDTPVFACHPTFNPSGSHFCFFIRYFTPDNSSYSLLIRSSKSGGLEKIYAQEKVSHFDWLNDDEIVVWARKLPGGVQAARRLGILNWPIFRPALNVVRKMKSSFKHSLLQEAYFIINFDGKRTPIGLNQLVSDGHPMFTKDRRFMLTDTYADQKTRMRELMVYDMANCEVISLGSFNSPVEFGDGDWKCDLHPRFNREDTMICIDSTHNGVRGVHVIPVGETFS